MQDRNESTIIHPFGFFDYFINRNGFEHFHKQFFRGLDLDTFGSPVTELNHKEESYCYEFAEESGEIVKRKVTFRNNLDSLLKIESSKYIKIIKEGIKNLDYNEVKIITYLKLQVGEIKLIANAIEKAPILLEYEMNIALFNIIKLLSDTYPLFISSIKSSFITESLESLNKKKSDTSKVITLPKQANNITTFKWTNNPLANTLTLYTILKKQAIISEDNTPLEDFQKVFSGIEILAPKKIMWLKKNQNSYANILIRILLFLIQRGYLQKISKKELANIIESAFIGGDSIPFKGIYNKIYPIAKNDLHKEAFLLEELNKHFPDKIKP